jgi:hypothetical protein
MIRFRLFVVGLIALSASLLNGCGSRNPPTYAIAGTVTYRGKPVENAGVMFMPNSGRPASGQTDAQGRFTLRTYKDNDGAIVGENIVCVSKMVPDPSQKGKDAMWLKMISALPARYATPVTSPLKVTVGSTGSNEFRFELSD